MRFTTLRPDFPINQPEKRSSKLSLIKKTKKKKKKNKARVAVAADMIAFPRHRRHPKYQGAGASETKAASNIDALLQHLPRAIYEILSYAQME